MTHKQSGKQHPSAAETANWKLTWEILTGKKKNTSHMTLNLLLVFLIDSVIIHIRGLYCKALCFYHIQWQTMFDSRPASQVWRRHAPQSALKRSSLKTAQDRETRVGHLNVIECQLKCCATLRTSPSGPRCIRHQISPRPISNHCAVQKEVTDTCD